MKTPAMDSQDSCHSTPKRHHTRLTLAVLALSFLSGCTSVFLQPDRARRPFVDADGLRYKEESVPSLDGVGLATWYFPARENIEAQPHLSETDQKAPKALVVQFHGNAENMTTHYRFVAWLPFYGYDLLTFDYRGYGASEGSKDVDGAYRDARAMIRHADHLAKEKNLPLVLIGQSLGGSLLLRALQEEHPEQLQLVMIESAFYAYRQIAREKLASTWLTWPFQWLAWPLISNRYSPAGGLDRVPQVPYILVYSNRDPVIPVHHGVQIHDELAAPKELWIHDGPGHVIGMFVNDRELRKKFLARLDAALESKSQSPTPAANEK